MKVRLLEHLVDRIDNELGRRKQELSRLRGVVYRNQDASLRALVRAGIPLIYAHWEGFVKQAASTYVSYVDNQAIPVAALTANFAALALRTNLLGCGVGRPTVHTAFIVQVRTGLNMAATLPTSAVDTKDNLRADVFREIVTLLGLSYDRYAIKETFIDKVVCDVRNDIAHGKLLEPRSGDYDTVHKGVVELMDMFRDDVIDAATNQRFRIA